MRVPFWLSDTILALFGQGSKTSSKCRLGRLFSDQLPTYLLVCETVSLSLDEYVVVHLSLRLGAHALRECWLR